MINKRIDPRAFEGQNTVLLTSFKRDGTPVGTPVHIAVDGNRLYFRSYEKAWKTKRIRRDPHIEIAPSTMRGTPTGPAIRAKARVLDGDEAKGAARAIGRKYPILHRWLIPRYHRLLGTRTVHFEALPIDASVDDRERMAERLRDVERQGVVAT